MIIQYQNNQRKFKAEPLKDIVERAVRAALRNEKIDGFLQKNSIDPVFSVTFTNNENIRKINKAYRNLDKPTDVLSFPMFEDIGNDEMLSNKDNSDCNEVLKVKKTSTRILTRIPTNQIFITSKNTKEANFGDIVISLEKAFEQSLEYGHSFEREVAFLTVHSFLHLIGYDHMISEDEKKMIKRQKQIMAEIETDIKRTNKEKGENVNKTDNKTEKKTEKKTDSKTIANDSNFKSGFVAIIGRPNVGKSTLLNTLSEMRLAIVSSKPQTTRHNIKLILNEEDSQIIFTDTPGIHLPKTKLAKKMVDLAYEALSDADVLLLMIDATKPKISLIETKCCELAQKFKKKVILIINKVDLIPKEDLFPIITKYSGMHSFDAIIPISVKDDDGIDILKKEIIKLLPVGPQYFPEDAITDQTERGITSELIREQILRFTSQEIPHGTAVEIEKFVESDSEEDESESIVRISAVIYCERDSHKKMLIGKNGEMIKRIGTHARKEIEKLLQSKVFLELHVKVREDWRNSHAILTNLGYK